jgi:hypothetical protein
MKQIQKTRVRPARPELDPEDAEGDLLGWMKEIRDAKAAADREKENGR